MKKFSIQYSTYYIRYTTYEYVIYYTNFYAKCPLNSKNISLIQRSLFVVRTA